MAILGAHQSIAGGYHRAVEIAHQRGCDCVQLFTRNCSQWRAKEIRDDEASRFHEAVRQTGMGPLLAHASYLLNLASPDRTLWTKSIDGFVLELTRAAKLGIPHVVLHPGAFVRGSEGGGLKRIVKALNEGLRQTRALPVGCLLETTAGQGSGLGCRFEHLATILEQAAVPERLGVCFDTCHVFAAGYPLAPKSAYLATMRAFDSIVGLERICAFHLNDSRGPLGCRVDRHAPIGRGCMGLEPFRLLLNDARLADRPMYLETPKGDEAGEDLDVINLRTLRELLRRRRKL